MICNPLELDIYIPSLKFAIEINGIFHYKPIFGQDKLDNIVRKDIIKNSICKNKNIDLITIKDTSVKFSEKYGKLILETIHEHIDLYIHKQKYKFVVLQINMSRNMSQNL